MSKLSSAFGQKFNQQSIRTRSFEFNGHTFKVKVPLTSETEAMFDRIREADETACQEQYEQLAKVFLENKEIYKLDSEIEFKEDDIFVKGVSLKETAQNKVVTQNRIVEMFRLLVPEEAGFDMNSISYSEIDELFPFSIQLQMMDEIGNTISPNYKTNKGK